MKMLFLCSTPLQCLIAEQIIEARQYPAKQCCLFYFSWVKNAKVDHYFHRLAARCGEFVFHRCDTGYPRNLLDARKFFASRTFSTVYCASTNNAYVQMALSVASWDIIETFDDGAANLLLTGPYAARYGMSFLRFLSAFVLGNRVHQHQIRQWSKRHYTIFKQAGNVARAPLHFIDIFNVPAPPEEGRTCTVILGTVFAEAAPAAPADAAQRLVAFARGLKGDVFYIPHPRGEELSELSKITLVSERLAEDLVSGLLARYASIDVYGFASSSQFVFLSVPRISNRFMSVPGLSNAMRALQSYAEREFAVEVVAL